MNKKFFIVVILFLFLLYPDISFLRAEDYSSNNFILRDPVIIIAGEQSSSLNFQYFSSSGQTTPGESTSSNFIYRSGFLYFPTANSPVLSATPGNAKVDLAWTPSIGALANVTHYELGTSTISGGPYTFEDVGNVRSFSKTSLANGTMYYFIIKAYAGDLELAQSSERSVTPVAPSLPPAPGGGGGGGPTTVATTVIFLGHAYPLSKVTVLKDGQIAITTIAGPDANFNVSLSGFSTGNYIFSLYGQDNKGRRSTLFNFPIFITQGAITTIGGIFITPTIDVDKDEVKRGDNIAIFGQSAPNAEVTIAINSDQEFFDKIKSQKDGNYLYNFDTSPLENGQHITKSKVALDGAISSFGKAVGFLVGNKTGFAQGTKKIKGDFNGDDRVNLIDFSIVAHWYKKPLSATFKLVEIEKLNGDGKIDFADFSILAYYWTG